MDLRSNRTKTAREQIERSLEVFVGTASLSGFVLIGCFTHLNAQVRNYEHDWVSCRKAQSQQLKTCAGSNLSSFSPVLHFTELCIVVSDI